MKTLITLLGLLAISNTRAQALDTTCVETKESITYHVIKRGEILHQKCKDGRNMFFYTPYNTYEHPEYLKERPQISGKGWYISSHGPDYFVVSNKSGTANEVYNFTAKEWSGNSTKPPWWRTGDREEK